MSDSPQVAELSAAEGSRRSDVYDVHDGTGGDRTGGRLGMIGRVYNKRDDTGFTLIELLIVIVILGILAAIVVFAVGTTSTSSVQAACKADAKSVETALESYKAQTGAYPADSPGGWTTLTSTGLDAGGNTIGPWLKSIPGTAHYRISFAGNAGLEIVSVSKPDGTNVTAFDGPSAPDACATNAQ